MGLAWNITKVQNWKQKQRKKHNYNVLNSLIWSTLIVGINEITEKNYKIFYARLTAYEHIRGTYLYKGNKPYYITLEDVKNWIGLWTNSDTFNATTFEKRLKIIGD